MGFRSPAPLQIAEEKAVSAPGEKYPNSALIVLFGALGAVVPIILLLLGRSGALDLFGLAILVWPTSIIMAGVRQSPGHITAPAFLLPVLIPNPADQDRCAQLRRPIDMIVHGWSTRRFQAKQQ